MNYKFPQIPFITYVVSKSNPHGPMFINEEFNSFRELYTWAIDCRDINQAAREEYSNLPLIIQRHTTLMEYVSEHCFRLLEENGYFIEKIAS